MHVFVFWRVFFILFSTLSSQKSLSLSLSLSLFISYSYRLAPEHHFPSDFNDCMAVTTAIADGAGRQFGIDSDIIHVAGDSAGGNLAASVAQAWRQTSHKPLRSQILLSSTFQILDLSLPSFKSPFPHGIHLSNVVFYLNNRLFGEFKWKTEMQEKVSSSFAGRDMGPGRASLSRWNGGDRNSVERRLPTRRAFTFRKNLSVDGEELRPGWLQRLWSFPVWTYCAMTASCTRRDFGRTG